MRSELKLEYCLKNPGLLDKLKESCTENVDAGQLKGRPFSLGSEKSDKLIYELKKVRIARFAEVLLKDLEKPILRDIKEENYLLYFNPKCLSDRDYYAGFFERREWFENVCFDEAAMKNSIVNPTDSGKLSNRRTTYLDAFSRDADPNTESTAHIGFVKGGSQEITGGAFPYCPRLEEIALEYAIRLGWLYTPEDIELVINHPDMENFGLYRRDAFDCLRTPLEERKAEYLRHI